jgi:2,3-bisphosphoglycerate-dependent phosphoglycerate mutase
MKRLVLVRHGESVWNKENRFTGWIDVPLSDNGVIEAKNGGKLLLESGFKFKKAYTSYLKRAIKTCWLILEEMDLMWIPVEKTWRLNEKHYGMLTGLNKSEMAEKYGPEQIQLWRRGFEIAPPALDRADASSAHNDAKYAEIDATLIPDTESLKDTIERIIPLWENKISKDLNELGEIMIAAHGNSLRGIVMFLKQMTESEITELNIPTGAPYIFEFDDNLNLVNDYFLGDSDEIKKRMEAVANQTKK